MEALHQVLRSWDLAEALVKLHAGASESLLEHTEGALGCALPEEFRACYRHTNGASVCHGNLVLYPLTGGDFSVTGAGSFLRGAKWPVPDEVIVFGNNGGDEIFGLWNPRPGNGRSLVVEIGSIFQPGCLAVVGTSVGRFLRSRTALHFALCEGPAAALDALDLPDRWRTPDLDDSEFDALARWSDPALPSLPLDSYTARLDPEAVSRIWGAAG